MISSVPDRLPPPARGSSCDLDLCTNSDRAARHSYGDQASRLQAAWSGLLIRGIAPRSRPALAGCRDGQPWLRRRSWPTGTATPGPRSWWLRPPPLHVSHVGQANAPHTFDLRTPYDSRQMTTPSRSTRSRAISPRNEVPAGGGTKRARRGKSSRSARAAAMGWRSSVSSTTADGWYTYTMRHYKP